MDSTCYPLIVCYPIFQLNPEGLCPTARAFQTDIHGPYLVGGGWIGACAHRSLRSPACRRLAVAMRAAATGAGGRGGLTFSSSVCVWPPHPPALSVVCGSGLVASLVTAVLEAATPRLAALLAEAWRSEEDQGQDVVEPKCVSRGSDCGFEIVTSVTRRQGRGRG